MISPWSKQITAIFISAIVALFILFCVSCKKVSKSGANATTPVPIDTTKNTTQDLTTKVSSSVSGFVTNEMGNPVNGAVVMVGGINIITDKYGYFEIKNVQVIKEAAFVTVAQPGYFKGIKTYIAKEGKSAFFRIQLIPKIKVGSVDATSGGSVALTTGLGINLPGNAVVNSTTNAIYTGQINIVAKYINPEGNDLGLIMPGDLRGLDSLGYLKLLTTYGIAVVELTGSGGELLQLATGKKATLTIPISTSLVSGAPSTIPLWYFDDIKGLWKQQGFAIKSGNNYIGDVSHFSFWNFDIPSSYVHLDCTVVNASGNPVANAWVKISDVLNPENARWGFTDSSGYVDGAIPANTHLLLEAFCAYDCNIPACSKAFTTTNANISLGNVTISSQNNATIIDTVIDCNGNLVTNGFIIMKEGANYYRFSISNKGTFNYTFSICNSPIGISIIAEDNVTKQISNEIGFGITTGTNILGKISVCGTNANVPFNCTIVNTAGNVIPNIWVKLSDVSDPNNSPSWSLTDSSGYVTSETIPEIAKFYWKCLVPVSVAVLYSQKNLIQLTKLHRLAILQ